MNIQNYGRCLLKQTRAFRGSAFAAFAIKTSFLRRTSPLQSLTQFCYNIPMILSEFAHLFNDGSFFRGEVKKNEPLSKHSTMHVGGNALLFIEPFDFESLIYAVKLAIQNNLEFFLAGGASNVIFPDEGLNLVITTRFLDKQNAVKLCTQNSAQNIIEVSAGSSWGAVLAFCKKNDLSGFENFCGLSGTVGGAIYMNASCFSLSTCERLQSVTYFDCADLTLKEYKMPLKSDLKFSQDWGYKKSPFQNNFLQEKDKKTFTKKIILKAVFSVKKGFDSERADKVLQERTSKGHFLAASAGSVFKNEAEKGIIAGKLLEECGLKGVRFGGAQISPLHANFIINPENKATSADIKSLVELAQAKVFKEKGVKLYCEIIFV